MSAPFTPHFKQQYETHLKHLRLKGLQPKTIDAYSRAIRRIGEYFDYQIEDLSEAQLVEYFTDLLDTHSWSAVKLDLYGLKFYYAHILRKPWTNLDLIKPPKAKRLPNIVTVEEAMALFEATRVLSYRVFFFTLYSMGLRLSEGLRLQVGDIDGARGRVHVRDSKGNLDRLVPLPAMTYIGQCTEAHRGVDEPFRHRVGGGQMILLSSLIETFEAQFLAQYGESTTALQRQALSAMKSCRTSASPLMQAQCIECEHSILAPHSCGHRLCPHCQHHESQQWLENQLKKQVPARYFLLTFTLPAELRALARTHQRLVYDLLIRCSWETVKTFSENDRQLQGTPGAIAVLHTHSRRLDYHPHVHLVMPAAALQAEKKLWRTTQGNDNGPYLFHYKALAKVFRAKMLQGIEKAGLHLPNNCPATWVVDVKSVGSGEKALVYLGRYLYRGVVQEKDIIACDNAQVTFHYRNSKTKKSEKRILPGAEFLALLLQHVLPKGFRRARQFGFLHPNSKRLIGLLQYLLGFDPKKVLKQLKARPGWTCPCCGAPMMVVKTRLPALEAPPLPIPIQQQLALSVM